MMADWIQGIAQEIPNFVEASRRFERERDEARGEAVRYRSLYYTQLGIDRSASWFPWEAKL